jgi:hypothetical protein
MCVNKYQHILSYEVVFAHLLGLALQLVVLAERIRVWFHTIRLASPAKLAQRENTVGSEVVKLCHEIFQNFLKKSQPKAKAVGEKVLENDGISSSRPRDPLTLQRSCLSLRI